MTAKKTSRISVLNWMGTIILTAIPGLSLIVIFLTLILFRFISVMSGLRKSAHVSLSLRPRR